VTGPTDDEACDRKDDEASDLIHRTRAWARADADEEGRPLRAPASEALLAETEERLGFTLHPLLRRLYTEVADGGFGPEGLRLLPLERLFPRFDPVPGEPRDWPDRSVAVMDIGCAMLSVVDCLDPGGQVLVMDPNAYGSNEPEAWMLDAASLEAWLEAWLDGTSWLIGDDRDVDDESLWPRRWEEASARLSA
jgi:hypothetical protein